MTSKHILCTLALAAFACKSAPAPQPLAPAPELPIAPRPPPAAHVAPPAPRSAMSSVPRPDLALPPVISGSAAAAQPTITIGAPPTASIPIPSLDGGLGDLALTLVHKGGDRSKDSHTRTMTVTLRAGHLVSETRATGRFAAAPAVRREGALSPDDFARVVSVIETQRLAESESHVTDITQLGSFIDVTLDIAWRGKKSTIRLAGMTRVMGSDAKTPFGEHPLSKRVAVLLTTFRKIIAGY